MAAKKSTVGRFGARYGAKIRQAVADIEAQRTKKCPNCLKDGLKRVSAGIWECKKCGYKFAGKAYKPK